MSTFIKSKESFVGKDGAEGSNESMILLGVVGFVDLAHFDDLEGLHDQHLRATSHPARDEALCVF